jgi:hypothetical protein
MTIGANYANTYTGTGSIDTYSYTFKIFSAADLLVTKRDADGVETTLSYPSGFSVTDVGAPAGGTITLTAGSLASGHTIRIRRVRPITQETSIRNQGAYFPKTHEDTFDHIVMVEQQLQDQIDRTMRASETSGGLTLTLPAPSSSLPLLGWKSDLSGIENKAYGPVGPQGTQGIQGIQGVQGTQGIQGPVGATGSGTSMPRGFISIRVTNNATDATNDIDISVGAARDVTNAFDLVLAGALTKQLDAAWAVGTNAGMRDTGAISNAWWHIFLIKRSDTSVVDVLASLSPTAPTMPTNYDQKRRIFSILRTGSSTLKQFSARGDYVRWLTSSNDASAATPGATAALYTMTTPTGVACKVFGNVSVTAADYVLVSDPAYTDATVNSVNCTLRANASGGGGCYYECFTDTSARVRARLNDGTVATLILNTDGYYDRRGQDD